MSESLTLFLARLTGRERALIALLVLVALPFSVIQGGALPLLARQDAARVAVADAEALRAWLQERQAEMALLPATDAGMQISPGVAPVGLSGIESGLIAAGLRDAVARLENPSGATVTLRFDEVPFTQLMPWLDTAESGMGYGVTVLRVARGQVPGMVAAEIQLEPRP